MQPFLNLKKKKKEEAYGILSRFCGNSVNFVPGTFCQGWVPGLGVSVFFLSTGETKMADIWKCKIHASFNKIYGLDHISHASVWGILTAWITQGDVWIDNFDCCCVVERGFHGFFTFTSIGPEWWDDFSYGEHPQISRLSRFPRGHTSTD